MVRSHGHMRIRCEHDWPIRALPSPWLFRGSVDVFAEIDGFFPVAMCRQSSMLRIHRRC